LQKKKEEKGEKGDKFKFATGLQDINEYFHPPPGKYFKQVSGIHTRYL